MQQTQEKRGFQFPNLSLRLSVPRLCPSVNEDIPLTPLRNVCYSRCSRSRQAGRRRREELYPQAPEPQAVPIEVIERPFGAAHSRGELGWGLQQRTLSLSPGPLLFRAGAASCRRALLGAVEDALRQAN